MASDTVLDVTRWQEEIASIKDEISTFYKAPYTAWYEGVTAVGYNLRSPARPCPMNFFGTTPELQHLYIKAITMVWKSHDYNQLIDLLVWLFNNCPEHGRTLYFSSSVISSVPHGDLRNVVTYAFIAGAVKGIFNLDVIVDNDSGNINTMVETLEEQEECPVTYLLCALRMARYPTRYDPTSSAGPETHPMYSYYLAVIRASIAAMSHPKVAPWVVLSKEFANVELCKDRDANELVKLMQAIDRF